MSLRSSVWIRKFSKKAKSVNFFTTPIYYVNASPHIGHLYTSLIADAAQRWNKVFDKDSVIKFSTGTDEHGSKIQLAANKHNASLPDYCDNISSQFKRLCDEFSVGYTNFVRTSNEKHKKTVDKFWKTIYANNHIYLSTYEGWYCVQDETFLTPSQLKESSKSEPNIMVSAESGHPVEWTREQNYMFKLSTFNDDLLHWLNSNETVVRPRKFHKILLDLLGSQKEDLSISRPSTRVHWGIPVPDDNSQTVYVWMDALANYLTVSSYAHDYEGEFKRTWPPDVQVIGKDILKFHGIYWPAFLIAADLEPPRSLLCHSHWTVLDEKMSKSKGNVVCPFDRARTYTTDGLRYFLLREGVAHSDGNYSDVKVTRILNSELADTLGNLLSRCTGTALNPLAKWPEIEPAAFDTVAALDVTKELIQKITMLPDLCRGHYDDLNFYKVADAVMSTLRTANVFFETLKPWELKKNPNTQKELHVILHLTLETLRVTAILLQPLIPNISDVLLDKINISKEERYFSNLQSFSWLDGEFQEKNLTSDKAILFKRILLEDTKVERKTL